MRARSLGSVIGERLRTARESAGLSQDEIAAAAGRAGLKWTRAAVASLETGRRRIDAEELLLLPAVLAFVLGRPCTLADLVADEDGDVLLAERVKRSQRDLRRQLAGKSAMASAKPPPAPDAYTSREADTSREAERHAARVLGVDTARLASTSRRLWGHGLSEERDARLSEALEELSGLDVDVRAVRGHITRKLLEELRPIVQPTRPKRRR